MSEQGEKDVENKGIPPLSAQPPAPNNQSPAQQQPAQTPNVWNLWENLPEFDPKLQYSEDGKMKLAQLDIKAKSATRVPYSKVEDFFDEKIGEAVDALVHNGPNSFSLFLTAENLRDYFHGKIAQIGGVPFSFQAYPPPKKEAPYFKEKPVGITTHMRLQNIPMDQPLQVFEEALTRYFPKYIKESASFETSSRKRRTRNGKITFYLEGVVYGIPGKHLKIKDSTVSLENHSNPLPLPNTPTWVLTPEEAIDALQKMEQRKNEQEAQKKGHHNHNHQYTKSQEEQQDHQGNSNTHQSSREGMEVDGHPAPQNIGSPSRSRSVSPSKRLRDERDESEPQEATNKQEPWKMVTYKKRKNSRPKSGSESSSNADSEAEELKDEKRRQKGKDHADAKKGPPHQKEHTRASDRLQKNQNQPKTESSQPKTESSQPKTSDNKGNKSKQNPKVGKPQLQKDTKNQVFNPALNTKVSVDHHYSPEELEASQQSILSFYYRQ